MRRRAQEIDHAIVEVAAGLFAAHGFPYTSVQQVADAVDYSKPGLLHRFGSKDGLRAAVLDEVTTTLEELLRDDRPAGELLADLTRRALARPGVLRLVVTEDGLADDLVDVLSRSAADPPRLRAELALRLVVEAATCGHEEHPDPEALVALAVDLACGVLADHREAAAVPAQSRSSRSSTWATPSSS